MCGRKEGIECLILFSPRHGTIQSLAMDIGGVFRAIYSFKGDNRSFGRRG